MQNLFATEDTETTEKSAGISNFVDEHEKCEKTTNLSVCSVISVANKFLKRF
jgi:hypothetical protein